MFLYPDFDIVSGIGGLYPPGLPIPVVCTEENVRTNAATYFFVDEGGNQSFATFPDMGTIIRLYS